MPGPSQVPEPWTDAPPPSSVSVLTCPSVTPASLPPPAWTTGLRSPLPLSGEATPVLAADPRGSWLEVPSRAFRSPAGVTEPQPTTPHCSDGSLGCLCHVLVGRQDGVRRHVPQARRGRWDRLPGDGEVSCRTRQERVAESAGPFLTGRVWPGSPTARVPHEEPVLKLLLHQCSR